MTERARVWLRDGAIWGATGFAVLASHVAAGAWLMHKAEAAQIAGLPEVFMVELAPMPEAAAPPDEVETVEQEETLPEPEPEPEPEEIVEEIVPELPLPELEPLPDMNSLFPPPPDAVVLERSERPLKRPEPPKEQPRVVERREPERKREPEAQAQQQRTRVEAPRAERTAAPAAQQGSQASPRQLESWQQKVQRQVARHIERTRVPGRRGSVTATVSLTVSGNGSPSNIRLTGTSGDPQVDAALSRQAARMPRLPAHPEGKSVPLTIPVRVNFR